MSLKSDYGLYVYSPNPQIKSHKSRSDLCLCKLDCGWYLELNQTRNEDSGTSPSLPLGIRHAVSRLVLTFFFFFFPICPFGWNAGIILKLCGKSLRHAGVWPSLGGEQVWGVDVRESPGYPSSRGLGPEPALCSIPPTDGDGKKKSRGPLGSSRGKTRLPLLNAFRVSSAF